MKKGSKKGAQSSKRIKKTRTYFRALANIGLLFTYLRIAYHEWLYKTHLKIRKAHDETYANIKWYKSWSDQKYSNAVHRSVLVAFILSFGFFSVFQSIFPYFGSPQKALADSYAATWSTKGDFESNVSTVNTASVRSNVVVSGSVPGSDAAVTLSSTNSPASWSGTSTGTNVPAARYMHSSIWTGTKMIVWGGSNVPYNDDSSGGIYDPELNSWTATSTGAGVPTPRSYHTAIWTGSKMIIWGGWSYSAAANTGGIYDPVANTWVATSTAAGVPTARYGHSAIWTGTHMVVWGGYAPASATNTGAIWTPNGGTIPGGSACAVAGGCWIATSTGTNLPTARSGHNSFWTGTQMIIWGGSGNNTGGVWTPSASIDREDALCSVAGGCWLPISTTGSVAVSGHSAVWTGTQMIVWGGSISGRTNTGTRYDPITDTWSPTATTSGVPTARAGHSATWTGTKMIVWGGQTDTGYTNTGGLYDPITNSWVATTTGSGVPTARHSHTTEWTGTKMIIWGGLLSDNTTKQNTGSRFTPATTVYSASGNITALKIDAGSGQRPAWSNIAWNGTEDANTNIRFRTRGASSEAGLASAAWAGVDGTPGTYYESSGDSITTPASQWLEIEINLTTTDGIFTPTLADFTVTYNTINSPTNIHTVRADDGTTEINPEGGSEWTNAQSMIIRADVEGINGTVITPQIAMSEGAIAPETSGDDDILPTGITAEKSAITYSDTLLEQEEVISLAGFTLNAMQYTYKLRYLDGQGRASAWSTPKTFKIDLVGPETGTIQIKNGEAKTGQRAVILTLDISDTETSIVEMRFSNDGENWSNWESYQEERAWIVSEGDGIKTVYAQGKDLVGNISGTNFTDTITLEAIGAGINFDPENKYPATNWNVKENVNSIEFSFSADKNAIAYVDYGPSEPNVEAHGTTEYAQEHIITIKNLTANTSYKYKIRLFDELGNMTIYPISGSYEATTTENNIGFVGDPLASNLSQVEITASVAKITWKTKEPTSSWVDYGLDSNYGNTAGDDILTTSHVVELKNLVAGKEYMYRVRGLDAGGNEFVSNEFNFKAIMKPLISNVTVDEVDSYSAVVSWTTNVRTDSDVVYGETTSYSNREKDEGYLTIHSVRLEDLMDDKTFHFQVEARDEYGNSAKSQDYSFVTPIDTAGPVIENVRIDIVPLEAENTNAQVIVSWKTDKPSTAQIEYGEGLIGGKYDKVTVEDTSLNYSHTSIIRDLNTAASYHFRIISKDKRGNTTESHDYNVVTPEANKSIWQLIVRSLEETFSWTQNIGDFFAGIIEKARY